MKKESIWLDGLSFPEGSSLEENIEVDVLIIGGGMTGMSTAYHLSDSTLRVCLVDANLIGHGVTSRTTGKLTYLQEDLYSKIEKYVGFNQSKLYCQSQLDAIEMVTGIIKKHQISCDLERVRSYLFTNSKQNISKITKEAQLLTDFGIECQDSKHLENDTPCRYSIHVPNTYVFHPLKYLLGLRKIIEDKGISIYENTRVESVTKRGKLYRCQTNKGVIFAHKVVLACHYPFFLIPFFFPLKVTLEKSYIGAFSVPRSQTFSAINVDKNVQSMRYHYDGKNHFQLFLTGSHNICNKKDEKFNFFQLEQLSVPYSHMWSNMDVMTGDFLPYVGEIKHHLFLATGYNTWGMTNGNLSGKIVSDLILGQDNLYQDLFSPKRGFNLGKAIHFPLSIGSSLKSFVAELISPQKKWYSDKIRFETRGGKRVAIYTDENGKEHVVYYHCPHLGCGLVFNEEEKTWDCPCHGSRFDLEGNCIEGPSKYNICYKEDN